MPNRDDLFRGVLLNQTVAPVRAGIDTGAAGPPSAAAEVAGQPSASAVSTTGGIISPLQHLNRGRVGDAGTAGSGLFPSGMPAVSRADFYTPPVSTFEKRDPARQIEDPAERPQKQPGGSSQPVPLIFIQMDVKSCGNFDEMSLKDDLEKQLRDTRVTAPGGRTLVPFASPEVNVVPCDKLTNVVKLGIWLTRGDPATVARRTAAVAALDLANGAGFAIFVSIGLFDTMAKMIFPLLPNPTNMNLEDDPNGDVTLRDMAVFAEPPNTITTSLSGALSHHGGLFGRVPFRIDTLDSIAAMNGQLFAVTKRDTVVSGTDQFIVGILNLLLPFGVIDLSHPGSGTVSGGIGAALLPLAPRQVIQSAVKLVLNYDRQPEVTVAGLIARGSTEPRFLAGTQDFTIQPLAVEFLKQSMPRNLVIKFSLSTVDFADLASVAWTSKGGATPVSSSLGKSTATGTLDFDTSLEELDSPFTRELEIDVLDKKGNKKKRQFTVAVVVRSNARKPGGLNPR